MTRIAILTPDDMSHEQRAMIAAAKANGKPYGGPFWAYIRNPKLMQSLHNMTDAIADSTLSGREQQIVALTVARFWNANYPGRRRAATVLKSDSSRQRSTPSTTAPRCRPLTSANC